MHLRTKILFTGYGVGILLLACSVSAIFEAGAIWEKLKNSEMADKPLILGIVLMCLGVWWMVQFVTHAYLGQEVSVEDLPRGQYRMVGREMHHIRLKEEPFEWSPFGRRVFHVSYKGDINYSTTYEPTPDGKLVKAHRPARRMFADH